MNQDRIDELRALPVTSPAMIIGSTRRGSHERPGLDVVSPIDGSHLTQLPNATVEDVDAAVQAARESYDAGRWAKLAPMARKAVMLRWAARIEEHALELAVLGVRDNGTEIAMAFKAEPLSAAGTIRYYAEAIDKLYGEIAPTDLSVLGLIHTEPVGVVGAIVPWNFPLMITAWKLGPALASGNSVVLKPSEIASLSVLRMVELGLEAGIPEGVFNVVTGTGEVAGQALARSMEVDALAFTGSGFVGRKLMEYAAQSNLKRVYLELGGKSPHVVFADAADLDDAAKAVVGGIFRNAGQVCVAGSRLLVEESIHDDFVVKVCALSEKMRVGDPLDTGTQIGALSSEHHLKSVLARLHGTPGIATGGNRILEDTGGSYMQPTVVTGLDPSDALVRNEVFGPVLTVTPFKDEVEAVALANDTDLGLASGVWTQDLSRAHRMINAIRAGMVHVNTYGGADVTVPLGGHKQSGNGQDKSLHALSKFTNKKTAWIKL
ncbi:MAG: aldehyde dehydrogenase family protein [Marinovum sp.]|nr:aldehyde dehydrogenase family protein [Marinovum sp.]